MKSMKRPYQLKRRAESQDRTRQKIVDAAIALHQSKGLAATTVEDIARRAKVGKVTVYRHFPDEVALVGACSGQYFQRHPLPDIEDWRNIGDPPERLRRGLRDTYRYHRETEAMMDGSDAVSDWPLLNLLLSTSGGATWVSFHHGGGVGMGYSQHAGLVICCDGTEAADARIKRVLWNDPASGVMRHADAGYEIAKQCAREHGLNLGAIEL